MDYDMVRRHLNLARSHVATGEQLIIYQKLLAERLQRDGHDTSHAED
jgi:hypothetical protein